MGWAGLFYRNRLGGLGQAVGRRMNFIQLADTHVIGEGLLYDHDPGEGPGRAVRPINTEHGEA